MSDLGDSDGYGKFISVTPQQHMGPYTQETTIPNLVDQNWLAGPQSLAFPWNAHEHVLVSGRLELRIGVPTGHQPFRTR